MRLLRIIFLSALIVWPLLLTGKAAKEGQSEAESMPSRLVVLQIKGPIGPATSDYFHRGMKKAADMGAVAVVLRMDTPGGLDTAMRRIIQDIISAPMPVIVFVAPSGARAASAGAYILYASHVAVMAPATNVGAATPVQIGGFPAPGEPDKPGGEDKDKKDKDAKEEKKRAAKDDAMTRKAVNDAVAYIRSLAQMRGRNVEWAEKAVREASSLPAEEAVKMNVADIIAADMADMLKKIDGRRVSVQGKPVRLKTAGVEIITVEPDWRNNLLSVITDPNIAYILMLFGIYGLFFELWNPGYVFPGVIGGICLLLALYAFQVLPINYAGLGLILLGIAFIVAEAFMPSFGALGIGGVIAFAVGSIILMDTDVEGYTIAWPLVLVVTALSAAFFLGVVAMALKARKRGIVSGQEEMLGSVGEALESFRREGRVRVHSEEWTARSSAPVKRGQKVRVTGMDGLILVVEPHNVEET